MYTVDIVINMLSWHNSPEDQKMGIALARQLCRLDSLFQPFTNGYSKDVWNNCALVISDFSDNELLPFISEMLFWLQDMNWPGAEIIQKRLVSFQKTQELAETLDGLIEKCIASADDIWLANLAELLRNPDLIPYLKREAYSALYCSQHRES